ncbi:DUF317 domain-containing protein [Streptomyces sp. NPDC002643]
MAAYETPVSERLWCMTLTPATPAPVLDTLLISLTLGDPWHTALGNPLTERTIADATRPLADAGWTPTINGHQIHWQTQHGNVGVQFDTLAANTPFTPNNAWTIWAGPDINHPTWTIHASTYTPTNLLTHLTEQLAHGTGTRQTPTHHNQPTTTNTTTSRPSPPPDPHRRRRH